MKEQAIAHLDKAVAPALKDKLYGTLTEYVRHFHGLLEERKALVIFYTLFSKVDDAEIEDQNLNIKRDANHLASLLICKYVNKICQFIG